MSGNIAPLFWAGVVMMGLVAPFSVDAVCRRLPAPVAVVLGSACALVGGLCLQWRCSWLPKDSILCS